MWEDENNGFLLGTHLLLPELLTYVFVYVPAKDLVRSCSLVCKAWNRVISSHHLWKIKAKSLGRTIPRCLTAAPELPKNIYRTIVLHNPFCDNLLRNPDGKEQTKFWVTNSNRGGGENAGWIVEDPPVGAQGLNEVEGLRDSGITSCFATTHFWCEKIQVVSLKKLGLSQEILRLLGPKLYICEWHAARFDCASRYSLSVELRDANDEVVGVPFSVIIETAQWEGSTWSKVEHTFEDLQHVKYIIFKHGGSDLQFWAGHYGSKMTGGVVRLLVT